MRDFFIKFLNFQPFLWFIFQGIALELMSKSVLNILEAATSLVSLPSKPAHILFVVGALSEFMSDSLALVMEKGCRVFCKSQTNVSVIFSLIFSFEKQFFGH